jgi:hypothetical protein
MPENGGGQGVAAWAGFQLAARLAASTGVGEQVPLQLSLRPLQHFQRQGGKIQPAHGGSSPGRLTVANLSHELMHSLVRQTHQQRHIPHRAAAGQHEYPAGQPPGSRLQPSGRHPRRPYLDHQPVKLGVPGVELVVRRYALANQLLRPPYRRIQAPGPDDAQGCGLREPPAALTPHHNHHGATGL